MDRLALWIEEYLEYCQVEKGLAVNSLSSYSRDLLYLHEFSRNQNWDGGPADYLQLMAFLNELHNKQLGSSSLMRITSTLRNFYRYLTQNGRIPADPTAQLESPKRFRRLPKMLSRQQIDSLLSQPDTSDPLGIRNRAMFELLYASGMRISEMLELMLHQLQLHLGFVVCYGKGSKERIAPVNEPSIHWLNRYLT